MHQQPEQLLHGSSHWCNYMLVVLNQRMAHIAIEGSWLLSFPGKLAGYTGSL